jgi:hypothetical protein
LIAGFGWPRWPYGVTGSPANVASPIHQPQAPAVPEQPLQLEKYMEVAVQGYTGMIAMHQEVKQVYEDRLKEKDNHLAALMQELVQTRKGFWAWLFGG